MTASFNAPASAELLEGASFKEDLRTIRNYPILSWAVPVATAVVIGAAGNRLFATGGLVGEGNVEVASAVAALGGSFAAAWFVCRRATKAIKHVLEEVQEVGQRMGKRTSDPAYTTVAWAGLTSAAAGGFFGIVTHGIDLISTALANPLQAVASEMLVEGQGHLAFGLAAAGAMVAVAVIDSLSAVRTVNDDLASVSTRPSESKEGPKTTAANSLS